MKPTRNTTTTEPPALPRCPCGELLTPTSSGAVCHLGHGRVQPLSPHIKRKLLAFHRQNNLEQRRTEANDAFHEGNPDHALHPASTDPPA